MTGWRITTARLLIGLVCLINLECAGAFLFFPTAFVSGFELSGIAGRELVRAMGLLFVMWNVPYGVAVLNPERNSISHIEAIVMQAIGVVGESGLLWGLPGGHVEITATLVRFIWFDAGGLVALLAAFAVLHARRV